MADPITLFSALNAAAPELRKAAPWLWKQLPQNTPIGRAITRTAEQFSTRLPAFDRSLETWIQSDSFRAQVHALEQGAVVESEISHAEQFVQATGFGLTAYSLDVVLEGLVFFYSELYLQLCEGDQGMRVVGAQVIAIHEELIHQRQDRAGSHFEQLPYRPPVQSDTYTVAVNADDRCAEVELSLIKLLVDKRQPRTALTLLAGLQDRVDSGQLSMAIRLRFYLNKGVCHLLLGQWDAAGQEFLRAQTIDPINRKTLINLAQVAIFKRHFESGLKDSERILAQDPNDSYGNSFRLVCLHELGRDEEITQLLKSQPALADDAQCLYTLAYLAADRGDYDEAEHYLRRHNKTSQDSAEVWELLGRTIVIPAQRELKAGAASTEWIPDAIRQRLEEAETCFSRAEALVATAETPRELMSILANRGMVRSLLGRYEDARKDCERALQIDPSVEEVRSNLGRLFLIQDNLTEAAATLEAIRSPEARADIAPVLATVYIELNKPAAARDVLESLADANNRDDRVMILGLLLLAYDKLGDAGGRDRILTALSHIKGDPEARRAAAEHYARKGDFDSATGLLRQAIEHSGEARAARYHLVLAHTLYRARRFAEAVQEYDQVPIPVGQSRECLRHLAALFLAGHFSRALNLAQAVRRGGPAVPDFSEIEALIQERLGDLESANRLRGELLDASIAPEHQKLRMAVNYLRQARRDDAAALVVGIDLAATADNPELLQEAAELRTLLELPGALDFAYQLLQIRSNDPEAHLFFVNAFFRREKIDVGIFHPKAATADCVVQLRHGDRTRRITIIGGETDTSRDWLSVSHPFAAQMFGKRVGETFLFPVDGPGSIEYQIEAIQSKFVAAFQDCLDRFNERFPAAYGLTRVEVSPGDPTEIVLMLERRRAHAARVLELYRSGHAPACMIAHLLGKSDAEFFRALISDEQLNVLSFDGTPDAIRREDASLAPAASILLEVSALVTLHSLNLLDVVTADFSQVLVTQQTADSLSEVLINLFPEREGGSIYSDTPGHICIISRSSDEAVQAKTFYQSLLEYVQSACHVVATQALEEFEAPTIRKTLGETAVSSLSAAKASGTLLVSDDLPLRVLAQNSHAIPTVGSLSLLRRIRNAGQLSREAYHDAVQWLVQHRFVFVSVDKDDIVWVLQKNNWLPTPDVATAFDTLSGPDCDLNGAVRIGLEVLREIWSQPLLPTTAQLLSDLLLHALVTGRNALQTIRLVASLHDRSSPLWTPASQQIQNVIRSWRPTRRLH